MNDDALKEKAEKAVRLYTEKGLTLTVAESCTGGLVSKLITDVSGASEVYPGGICSYGNSVKERLLGVKSETLEAFGAVSEATAREMAEGVKKVMNADVGVAITGIAGPGSDGTDKPVGLIYLAISGKSGTKTIKLLNRFDENIRENNRKAAADAALELFLTEESL